MNSQIPFSRQNDEEGKAADAVSGTVSVSAKMAEAENGSAVVDITSAHISQGIRAAREEADRKGVKAGNISVNIHIGSEGDENAGKEINEITVNLPKDVQKQVVENKIECINFVFEESGVSVRMDLAAVAAVKKQAKGDAQLVVKKADASSLLQDAKAAAGSRPLYDLKILYNKGAKTVDDFGKGNISVAIPYILQEGENAGGVTAIYVDGNGQVHYLSRSVYDMDGEILRFATNHFSVYGIGYRAPAAYKDVKNSWAEADIAFVSSRDLIGKTGENAFSPGSGVTRGEFVVALARLAEVNLAEGEEGYGDGNENEAGESAPYVSWALENGILNRIPGEGSSIDSIMPEQILTRQEAAVILFNYAKATGMVLVPARGENAFKDEASVAAYAKEAVKAMQTAGVMNGKDGYLFDPSGCLTRAEACNLLRHYAERTIEPATALGWTKNASGHWQYYRDGRKLTGWQTIDGLRYEFGEDGTLAVGIKVGGE